VVDIWNLGLGILEVIQELDTLPVDRSPAVENHLGFHRAVQVLLEIQTLDNVHLHCKDVLRKVLVLVRNVLVRSAMEVL